MKHTESSQDELLRGFLSYVRAHDSAAAEAMTGSTGQEIAWLESEIGQPVTGPYRELLALGGRNLGPVPILWDCSYRVPELLRFTRENSTPLLTQGRLLIGVEGYAVDQLAIDLNGDDQPVYFRLEHTEWIGCAESLVNYCFGQAFIPLHRKGFAVHSDLVSPAVSGLAKGVRELLQKHGFHPEWFTDSFRWCATSQTGVASVLEYEGAYGGVVLGLASVSNLILDEIHREVRSHFPTFRVLPST